MKYNNHFSMLKHLFKTGIVFDRWYLTFREVKSTVVRGFYDGNNSFEWYKNYIDLPYGFYLELLDSETGEVHYIYGGKSSVQYGLMLLATQDVLLRGQHKPPFSFLVPVKTQAGLGSLIAYLNATHKMNLSCSFDGPSTSIYKDNVALCISDNILHLLMYLYIGVQLENIQKTFNAPEWNSVLDVSGSITVHKTNILSYVKRVPCFSGNLRKHPYVKHIDEFMFNIGCMTISGGQSIDTI